MTLTPGVFDKGGIARYGRYQIQALREILGRDQVRVLSLMGPAEGDLETPFHTDWHGRTPVTFLTRARFVLRAFRDAYRLRPRWILCGHVHLAPVAHVATKVSGARMVVNIYGHEIWSGLSGRRARALSRAEIIIADAGNTAQRTLELGLVTRPPVVIRDCVDVERFTPGEPDWERLARYNLAPSSEFRIGFLGRLHPYTRYKGSERLLRLLARLPDGFRCIIAGRGDDVAALQALSRDLGVSRRVSFPGPLHEEDLVHFYRCLDSFYLVSEAGPRQGEGLPLTPIEAMATGCPVLVGNQDGSREILENGGGVCTDPRDLEAQADYLQRLRRDSSFHQSERKKARQRVEDAFTYEVFRDLHRHLFRPEQDTEHLRERKGEAVPRS